MRRSLKGNTFGAGIIVWTGPVVAEGEMASRIIERVDRLSEPYSVRIRAENGIGIVRPPS